MSSDISTKKLKRKYAQFFDTIKKMSIGEKRNLINYLKKDISEIDSEQIQLLSENVLAEDWLTELEDEAWSDL